MYELESRVLTDHWSIPYKREESLGKCLIASTYLARLGKFSFYTCKDYLFKGFSYVFRINLAVVYLAPCRTITSLWKWLTVNCTTQCCKKNVGLSFFFFSSKVICLLKLFFKNGAHVSLCSDDCRNYCFSELNYWLFFSLCWLFSIRKNKLSSKSTLYHACITGCFSLVKCLYCIRPEFDFSVFSTLAGVKSVVEGSCPSTGI